MIVCFESYALRDLLERLLPVLEDFLAAGFGVSFWLFLSGSVGYVPLGSAAALSSSFALTSTSS